MAYEALVTQLKNVRPHPNADKLKMAYCNGYNVIVGLDAKENDTVIIFVADGQLSEEYAEANDLIAYVDPDTGERKGGYFAKNRRVRSQRLRGEKSECYVASLDSLSFTGFDVSKLNVGDTFEELNGVKICGKYYTPATLRQMNQKQQVKRANKCFPKHVETEKLQYEVDKIQSGSIIYITEKIHGTSARYAYVLDEKESKRTWKDKLFRRPAKIESDWDFLIGTRNMVLGKSEVASYYGSEEFRHTVGDKMRGNLHKGEVIYGEIVGYTHTGAPIMGEHDTTKLNDKALKKKYGSKMVYKYGNVPGNCEFYVYRIARVNEDGFYIDLPWPQVKKRCNELGLKFVPEMATEYTPFIYNKPNEYGFGEPWVNLIEVADSLMEGSSLLDESHIREGVVFRVESPDGNINYFKSKSFTFGLLEGYIKEKDDYVDAEEIA